MELAEIGQAAGLAAAVAQFLADGQALLQAGQRLAVLSLPVVAGAEVVVGLGLGGQVTRLAGEFEGDLVCLHPIPSMVMYPEEAEQRLGELHPDLGRHARGGRGLLYRSQQAGPFSLQPVERRLMVGELQPTRAPPLTGPR